MTQEIRDLFEGAQFTLDESKATKFEGVLASVKGPFGLTEKTNRNGRIYTNDFWEYVLGKPETQARLAERAIIGELEHPNSIQTKLGHISHVVTHVSVKPDTKELYGEADILDTPSGRILHTLFKAGVKVGISSRGAGSLVEEGSGEGKKKYVKKEDYVFGGFDFVSDPSAPNAFPKLSEGQIASLIESLAAHSEQIQEDKTGFYDAFLSKLGVPGIGQDRVELSEGTDLDVDDADLEAQEATIADLRSKMRQMVERHREMSSQMARMQEKSGDEETPLFSLSRLTDSVLAHKAKAMSLGQRMSEIQGELNAARRRINEFREMDRENIQGASAREEAFSREIENLKEQLDKSRQDIEEQKKLIENLGARISDQRSLAESKADKLGVFRRELLESLSAQFNCDLRALAEGLRPGFGPEEAVARAAECSRSLHQHSLPLGGVKFHEVKDLDGEDPTKTALKERRKDTLRRVRGRKN